MFLKAQEEGMVSGFKVGSNGRGHPILQFVDDTLLLVSGSLKEARVVRSILVWFEACLGLMVNAL